VIITLRAGGDMKKIIYKILKDIADSAATMNNAGDLYPHNMYGIFIVMK